MLARAACVLGSDDCKKILGLWIPPVPVSASAAELDALIVAACRPRPGDRALQLIRDEEAVGFAAEFESKIIAVSGFAFA